jgi:NADPH:quinone reductase-like Zn-dependent oxidoreductase
MKVYEILKGSKSLDGLRRGERPDPEPGPREVLIRVHATSLNYRDQQIVAGTYFGGPVNRDIIPLSDGAGQVVGIGPGVTRFKPGDRVAGTFFQGWVHGTPSVWPPSLGVPLDGTLAEYVVLHEKGVVAIPESLSYEEAATLPCAGVTAWNGLMVSGRRVKAGDTVLCLGTGGVSMFAVQFAKLAGARPYVTSSSDEKIKRAQSFGAFEGINYKLDPDWEKEVQRLTSGRGVDIVVELGGPGTMARSFQSVAFGGKVVMIGVLAGLTGDCSPHPLMLKNASAQGISVGSREMFEEMNRAIDINKIKPVIGKIFSFEDALEAFRHHASGAFVGKVVIAI